MLPDINPLLLVGFFSGSCFGFVVGVIMFAARSISEDIPRSRDRDQ